MTVDRWGKRINLAWAAHEMVWLEAAIFMDVQDRVAAYRDIADMSGRSLEAVRRMANSVLKTLAMVAPELVIPTEPPAPANNDFEPIRQPTKQQLMGRR